ncbi:GPCR fungal pheromone mating factor [Amylostereum chailletii]|nr:GPCR fungal pheromone mating factor [Amylostereum chailletii]
MNPAYPLLPIGNFVSAALILISMLNISVRQSWNTGVCVSALWGFLMAIVTGVDAVVWADNASVPVSPIWSDIASHIQIGSNVGVPMSTFIITRRLYKIVEIRSVNPPTRREVSGLLVDWCLGLGVPVIMMGVYYVVQTSRFQTLEEYGCSYATASTGLTSILIDGWSVVLPTISIVFYSKIFYLIYHHNKQFNDFLQSQRNLPRSRYLRILALGCIDAFGTLPIGILVFVVDVRSVDDFWPGWSVVHSKADWPPQSFSTALWSQNKWSRIGLHFSQWINVADGVVFFLFFGLTGEARALYRRAFGRVVEKLGWRASPASPPDRPGVSGMVFGSRQVGGTVDIPQYVHVV